MTISTTREIKATLVEMKALSPAGFAIGFHMEFATPAFMFQTYPKEWLTIYNQKGLMMQDPINHFVMGNTGTTTWSALAENDPADVFGQASEFGMKFGIACAFEEGSTRSVAGFARGDREMTPLETETLFGHLQKLHRVTADAKTVDQDTRKALRDMAINLTHL